MNLRTGCEDIAMMVFEVSRRAFVAGGIGIGLTANLVGVLAVFGLAFAIACLPKWATAQDSSEQKAWAADEVFLAALARGDGKAVETLLLPDFSWITTDGEQLSKSAATANPPTTATDGTKETDVQHYFYGRLATIRGSHNGIRFLRVLTENDGQWRLFAAIDTRVIPAERASVEAQAGIGDCNNPCRTVPYTPTSAMDKEILASWQQTKMVEWKPNAAVWLRYIADEFMIINNNTIRTRSEREAIAKRQEETGIGTPGDPILSMSISDFGGNAAVMFSKHFPVRGGKPYNNIRVWVKRDDRWQLTISQQSETKSAAPIAVTAAAVK
jgi:Domain of unknown function (DUF4440)